MREEVNLTLWKCLWAWDVAHCMQWQLIFSLDYKTKQKNQTPTNQHQNPQVRINNIPDLHLCRLPIQAAEQQTFTNSQNPTDQNPGSCQGWTTPALGQSCAEGTLVPLCCSPTCLHWTGHGRLHTCAGQRKLALTMSTSIEQHWLYPAMSRRAFV